MAKNDFFKFLERILGQVFEDEPVPPPKERTAAKNDTSWDDAPSVDFRERTPPGPRKKLPSLLVAARSLEKSYTRDYYRRENIFMQQAKLLENYEDEYVYEGQVSSYFYPTYSMLSDAELRGYFSWRTKLRRGEYVKAPVAYVFLNCFELINQIGVKEPMEGYQKLKVLLEQAEKEGGITAVYLDGWLFDYAIYYNLDPVLLKGDSQDEISPLRVLENVSEYQTREVMEAVKARTTGWLERSKFYREHGQDMDVVIHRVLQGVSKHYADHSKKTMTEQFFGTFASRYVTLFSSAVFCDPLKRTDYQYTTAGGQTYQCRDGSWYVMRYAKESEPSAKLGDVVKTIDAIMRQEYNYGHPIKLGTETKWILKIIREEVQTLLTEKQEKAKAAEALKKERQRLRLTIDPARLEKIRQDAAITRDKLMVEEETLEELPPEPLPEQPEAAPLETPSEGPSEDAPELPGDCPLAPQEYRFLQCLLYGYDLGWVRTEGLILSVLVDGINEKLYDTFMDSVLLLEGEPQLIEDYTEDLKEMVRP